jgi:hypothetical protein
MGDCQRLELEQRCAMVEIPHAVVIVGYAIDGTSKKVYINDPSGALMENFEESVVGDLPYIAVQLDWNDVASYIGRGWASYAIAVGGTPNPPKGTIDLQDYGFYFCYPEKPDFAQVYSWFYGLDKGLIWEHFPLHPLALNPEDWFKFDKYVANHLCDSHAYKFEIEFAKEGYSNSHFVEIAVDGRSRKNNIMMDSIPLRDILEAEYGEYTVTLTLWDTKLEKKYDEIVFPRIKYTPPDYPDYPGYAIIVAGEGGHIEKTAIDHSANNAYRVLRNLGFDDDHIFYLNSNRPQDVDGDEDDEIDALASFSNFDNAINEVKDKIEDNPTPFILFLTGHGLPGQFLFDGSVLCDYQLKGMLEEFPSETRMLIFIDSCNSGDFITSINGISASNRIIITGTHNNQKRLWIPWLRSSDRFWGNLNKGLNVKDAFITGAWPGEWWHLWLNDNGDIDRIGSPPNNLGEDGNLAARTQIGVPGTENLKLTPWIFVWKRSPGELRVYDSQNQVTGLVV